MFTDWWRNFARLVIWGGALCGLVIMTAWATVMNFQACKAALELQGYENQPLATDKMLGQYLGALFPNATLAHGGAAVIAFGIAIGSYFFFHLVFYIYRLHIERQALLIAGNESKATDHMWEIKGQAIFLVPLVMLLICVIYWDVDLYRFRSIAGMLGIDDPLVAPTSVPSFEVVQTKYAHLAATKLSLSRGAYGYICSTMLLCLLLEIVLKKLSDAFARVFALVDKLFEDDDSTVPAEFYGYDEQGQPVYDQDTPIVYDTKGALLETELGNIESTQENYVAAETVTGDDYINMDDPVIDSNNDEVPTFDAIEPEPETGANTENNEEATVKVIDGNPDKAEIRFTEALADQNRYYVDPVTSEVWDRSYWSLLNEMDTVGMPTNGNGR